MSESDLKCLFRGRQAEDIGNGLGSTDLESPVIGPLLALVGALLDSVGCLCDVLCGAPNSQIIRMQRVGDVSRNGGGDAVDVMHRRMSLGKFQ